jgi:hypothetical protein
MGTDVVFPRRPLRHDIEHAGTAPSISLTLQRDETARETNAGAPIQLTLLPVSIRAKNPSPPLSSDG